MKPRRLERETRVSRSAMIEGGRVRSTEGRAGRGLASSRDDEQAAKMPLSGYLSRMAVPSETAVPPAGLAVSLNRALRTYQWVKNVLLFVPMLMAHRVGEGELWVAAALGFVAFSLTASSGYVVNDLVDR